MNLNRPKGLGRGLGALIGPSSPVTTEKIEPPLSPTEGLRTVPIFSIVENAEQPRRYFDPAALEDLAASIREHGIMQPLVVMDLGNGDYELIAGERRLRASKIAGLQEVPVLVRKYEDDRTKLVLALIENIQRQDLNAIEEAYAYQRLIEEYGLTHDEVAKRMGKSRPVISNTLRLLELDADMRVALEEGVISKSHARTLLGETNPDKRRELFDRMTQKGGMSVREAETKTYVRPRYSRAKDPNIAILEIELREALGTKVNIEDRGVAGKIIIDYFSREDLRTIAQKIKE
jgi:ParB family chromosome partitioning protein